MTEPWHTPIPAHPWIEEGATRVRFGVVSPPDDWPAARDWVQLVEGLGFDSCWTFDHPARVQDGWTRLATLATVTRRVRLGVLVSCVYYRSPVLLARLAADVDRDSGGRLVLGLGIGWDPAEFAELGIPFPRVPERQRALADTVEIVRGLWSGERFHFASPRYRIDGLALACPPIQRPRVPLLIGGGGAATLRQVARYADVANFGASDPTGQVVGVEAARARFAILRQHCQDIGRPSESVLRSYYTIPVVGRTPEAARALADAYPTFMVQHARAAMVVGTPDQVIPVYQQLIDAGAQYFIAAWQNNPTSLRLLAEEVVPRLRPA
ncbi:MAG: LLM class flavin-dependent oxidoreductase [Chloroflexota bacterium]